MKDADSQAVEGKDSFPGRVDPAASVERSRQLRLQQLTYVTAVGIAARILIIAIEFWGVWLSGSSALFVDAVSSLFDVVSSLVLLIAIRLAARPPDKDHPFGHGRVEPLAGFQLGVLLFVTGCFMAYQSLVAISGSHEIQRTLPWVWMIPTFATALLFLVTRWIDHVGKSTRSSALQAEAKHFQVDAATSLIAAVTLLVASFWTTHANLLDHLGAGVLSLLMIILGAQATWENVHQLLDHVPQDEDFKRVRESAMSVNGVIDVEKLQIQHAGPDAHVNIDIEVQPEISVAQSHVIAQHVRARIQTDWPFVRDVIVHVEPYYEGDH
ncbi:cation diffusion facilitator family transporter [Planctomicrobium sp. SH668]|uniref:cation diffusion facilitator family transporter n=1 Tax=Planctomicrobium sp. SH668 TaxID=3448126 RepID=UPI003F5C1189